MRLDISYSKKNHKNTHLWRLNNPLLNGKEVTEKIRNQKILRNKWQWKHDNPNLWDSAKAYLRGRFIVIQSHLKKQDKHWIDSLPLSLKQLGKEKQEIPKVSRGKEIIKIRAEITEKEKKRTIAKINKTKSWFIEKINKTDKPLARLIKKKREKSNQ